MRGRKPVPVYKIHRRTGDYTRYPSISEAVAKSGYSEIYIRNSADKMGVPKGSYKDHVFIYESDYDPKVSYKSGYDIERNGKKVWVHTISEAAKFLGVEYSSVQASMKKDYPIKGFVVKEHR